jgi:hypothetical protein
MCGVKVSEVAHVWLQAVCQMVKQVYIDSNPCALFKKEAVTVMPTTVFWWLALFVTRHIWSQNESRSPFMVTSSIANGQTGLY